MFKRSVFALALLAAVPAMAAAELSLTRLTGTATISRDGKSIAASLKQGLNPGDVIAAGGRSRVGMGLGNGGMLTLAGLSELQVFEAGKGNAKTPTLAKLKLLAGALRVNSTAGTGKLPQDVRLNVGLLKTRIYGSEVWGASTAEGDTVCLISGAVEIQTSSTEPLERLSEPGACLRRAPDGRMSKISAAADAILPAAIAATTFPPEPLLLPPAPAVAAAPPKPVAAPPPPAAPVGISAAAASAAMSRTATVSMLPPAEPPKPIIKPAPVVKIIPTGPRSDTSVAKPMPAAPAATALIKPLPAQQTPSLATKPLPAPAAVAMAKAVPPAAPATPAKPLTPPPAPVMTQSPGQILIQTPVQTIVQSTPVNRPTLKTAKPTTLPELPNSSVKATEIVRPVTEPAKAIATAKPAAPAVKPEASKPAAAAVAAIKPEASLAKALAAAPAAPTAAKPASGRKGWTVVVASSTNKKAAESRTAALQDQGFVANLRPAEVNGATTYRLTVGEFATKEEAQAYSEHTLAKSGLKGWLSPL